MTHCQGDKVALEDAEGALRMSKIGDSGNTNVSFRHLAMLAQVKSDDEICQHYWRKVSTV